MLDYFSARQIDHWLKWLAKYHPFPDRNDVFWSALLAMTHNIHCLDSADVIKPADCMPYSDPYPDISREEMKARLKL